MTFWEYILDFFKRLVRSRTDSVQIKGKTALRNVEYKAKSAVSNKFNRTVDGAVDKAKNTVKKKPDDKPKDDAAEKTPPSGTPSAPDG